MTRDNTHLTSHLDKEFHYSLSRPNSILNQTNPREKKIFYILKPPTCFVLILFFKPNQVKLSEIIYIWPTTNILRANSSESKSNQVKLSEKKKFQFSLSKTYQTDKLIWNHTKPSYIIRNDSYLTSTIKSKYATSTDFFKGQKKKIAFFLTCFPGPDIRLQHMVELLLRIQLLLVTLHMSSCNI
jgi:hypothetical protein